jgi:hypothetical protein
MANTHASRRRRCEVGRNATGKKGKEEGGEEGRKEGETHNSIIGSAHESVPHIEPLSSVWKNA